MFSWIFHKRKQALPGMRARRKLYMPEDLYRRMLNHCREEVPLEACGLLVGEGGQAVVGYATDNQHRSPVIYKVDDQQLCEAVSEIRHERHDLIGIYHSHVKTDPVPSRTDIQQATWPEAFYLIVSLKERRPRVRAWRIVDGQVTAHQIVVQKGVAGQWRDLRRAVRKAADAGEQGDLR